MSLIAPSILSADFLQLSKDVQMVNDSQADWFHLDIMDGRFVPNISFGLPVVGAIKREAKKTLDVHLMIEEPGNYAEAFQKAGADILSVHIEACPHLHRNLQQIHSLGMKAGVAINPHTPVSQLFDVLHDVDVVCMMSVNPGFGGQKFIEYTLDKIRTLKAEINRRQLKTLIEIDGGVTLDNAKIITDAGADVLVAGNTVFSAADPTATIAELKRITSAN
ncbi:MAG: ribulose-phosphate 3-epimerase [Chitinophagaceae bacterium]|nr:ribulose-phosphate 3-epimerase [Chitinophagaceae bacterium]